MAEYTKESKNYLYSVISNATVRFPVNGIKNLSEIAKKYSIPISWIITYQTIRYMKDIFDIMIRDNQDELIFQLQSSDYIMDNPGMQKYRSNLDDIKNIEIYQQMIKTQKKKILEIFPKIRLDFAYLSIKNTEYIEALKNEGFKGIIGTLHRKDFFDIIIKNYYAIPFQNLPSEPIEITAHSKFYQKILKIGKFLWDISLFYNPSKNNIDYSFKYWKSNLNNYLHSSFSPYNLPIFQFQAAHKLEMTMKNNKNIFPFQIENKIIEYGRLFEFLNSIESLKIIKINDIFKNFDKNHQKIHIISENNEKFYQEIKKRTKLYNIIILF